MIGSNYRKGCSSVVGGRTWRKLFASQAPIVA
ncbi:hypothetical protein SAMN05192558_109309 [Actinokineospora alba]|uniref:Uncharacterized protein n=1 Tax=Actinokineospora alba TaxID=504798 RepID=A0A1H0T7Y3_9PSEU|nr:hypothetical protein C8E96_1832 [Actinokineospora alba]SDJ22126.1 hypothetical protein SAMN05421871_11166 [Actinokineospora alba]SDP49955.1 hypothetical protein SAMN05192558_109309 [Actinokineospora alba]